MSPIDEVKGHEKFGVDDGLHLISVAENDSPKASKVLKKNSTP
jgi:hypothetical protein